MRLPKNHSLPTAQREIQENHRRYAYIQFILNEITKRNVTSPLPADEVITKLDWTD